MKLISTYVHGVLDYITGFLLFFAPVIFGFSEVGGIVVALPRVLGILIILQALITKYELSLTGLISMRTHLWMDYAMGFLLAVSPWLFEFSYFSNNVWMPHLLVGLAIIGMALVTDPIPRHHSGLAGHGV